MDKALPSGVIAAKQITELTAGTKTVEITIFQLKELIVFKAVAEVTGDILLVPGLDFAFQTKVVFDFMYQQIDLQQILNCCHGVRRYQPSLIHQIQILLKITVNSIELVLRDICIYLIRHRDLGLRL